MSFGPMRLSGMIRHHLIVPYLALVILFPMGVGAMLTTVSADKVEQQSAVQERLRQISSERQESIEVERQETAEAEQIAHDWQVRAVQLARFIERQGLSVPKPTVALRDVPPEGTPLPEEPSEPGPVPTPDVPTPVPEQSTLEPLPVVPPPTPEPEVSCIPLPTLPDFCFVPPTPPNP